MSEPFFFELCAETLEAALAAEAGGAHRIELCEQLSIGGVTPSAALLSAVLSAVSLPVHVLIRPRGGDFVYTAAEFAEMRLQIELARDAGAAGVVLGVLLPNGRVDIERTRTLVALARPLEVNFHRAFDETADLAEAFEDVVQTGADGLLTSGGASNVLEGADRIGQLRTQAADRIQLMAGAGLKLATLSEVVRRSGVYRLHGSLSRNGRPALAEDVREAVRLLRESSYKPAPEIASPKILVS